MTPDDLLALEAAIGVNLAAEAGVDITVTGLRTLAGGRSGVTLIGEVHGLPDVEAVVVKAAPMGRPPVGRHDVLRQARVLRAVSDAPGVVVPTVLAVGTEPVHHYVMTRSTGEAVEPVLDADTVHLDAELLVVRAHRAAGMLAALHRCAVPAQVDGVPEPVSGLTSEVERWQAVGEAADAEILINGATLATKLAERTPIDTPEPVLIHGDFRLGNLVFDGPNPTGLIDWEIWGRSHPGIDLGWFLVFCDADAFPGVGQPVEGLPSSDELISQYIQAGGATIADLAWFEAFGRFKMAVIMAHNLRRHREGRHPDPYQEKLPPTIARLVETGIAKLDA